MPREASEDGGASFEEGGGPPSRLAHYERVRSLGRGGMGEVWLYRLVAGVFSELVAVKSVAPELASNERKRLELGAEAELLRELDHRNIARAYGLEVAESGCYLVLEYVDGLSVAEVLARARGGGMSEGFSCHVAASVAEALEYAHGRKDSSGKPLGIVHRDVKAANVMVSWSGVVKLLDFGVAYSRREGRERTETGTLKGTFGYLSPEQARGRGEPVDGRSDLFSLGIVLVELLTGKRPFEAESDFETLRKIGECEAVEVEEATGELPAGLREVCRKALAKDPADRFGTGGELAQALREYLVGRGISYGASECARDLREERLGGSEAWSGEGEGTIAGGWAGESMCGARAGSRRAGTKGVGRRVLFVGLVLVGGALGLGGAALLRGKWSRGDGAPAAASDGGVAVKEDQAGDRCEAEPGALVALAEADVKPGGRARLEDLVVVRPKGTKRGGSVRPTAVAARSDKAVKGAEEGGRAGERGESAGQARGGMVLARGTLIGAELVDAIDASSPRIVEVRVREDVEQGGLVRVPRGSGIVCSSGRGEGGRVELACDEIRVGKARFALSGIAVQGGDVGLRAIGGVVPAGTSFAVYVSAAASW